MPDPLQRPAVRKVYICRNGDCIASDEALEIYEQLQEWIAANHLDDFDVPYRVKCFLTGCLDICEDGPILTIQPDQVSYHKVNGENLATICKQHLLHNQVIDSLIVKSKKKN